MVRKEKRKATKNTRRKVEVKKHQQNEKKKTFNIKQEIEDKQEM